MHWFKRLWRRYFPYQPTYTAIDRNLMASADVDPLFTALWAILEG